jgi:predicted alpha-1,6-mannanase (GH76 family)
LLRACDLSASVKRQYWSQVVTLFDDIIGGWSDVDGGGLHWNKNKTGDGRYKTSCSNGPAMILAARLYQQTGEERYLEWAQRIYEYMYTHNRFPDGVIKDHATYEDHEVTFSYNQGTWVGGLLELYKITGEEHYRTTATDLLDLLLFGKWYSPKGIINERQNYNQDDGGMFKGIFVRYLTQWLLSGRLDSERQYRYTKWLLEQARAAELSAINKTWYIINPYWTHQYHLDNDVHDTSRQQTGMMLMEAIDELRRAGLLRADYSLPNPHIGKPFRYYRLVITETQGSGTIMLGSWKLIGSTSPTAVTSPTINNSSSRRRKSYNLMGISASASTTGIHIHNGMKFVNRQ